MNMLDICEIDISVYNWVFIKLTLYMNTKTEKIFRKHPGNKQKFCFD